MTKKFKSLPAEKQQRILKAALREFTEHSFAQASTNRIVKDAGIGKGMLFYYFKSKKDLYYYLADYGMDYIKRELLDKVDEGVTDFIEKNKQMSMIKMKAYQQNPEVFNFVAALMLNRDPMFSGALEEKLVNMRLYGYQMMFENIDKSLFREDIDPDEAIRLIRLSMDGYEKELIASLQGKKISEVDMDPYWDDFFRFLDLLKKVLYK